MKEIKEINIKINIKKKNVELTKIYLIFILML